jgi:2-amino-4-hydroxy-6-hydroxymethyldihydropteridine diphosphokinase
MNQSVYIGLGSNLGDRAKNLNDAIAALNPGVQLVKCSPVYETHPWGYQDQPQFLNQVVLGMTELSPRDLLSHLKDIENRLGRVATFQYGPRLIDLDILLYADQVIDLPGLKIPHPYLEQRAFVLVPLVQLAPDLVHPVLNRTLKELLNQIDASGVHQTTAETC